jgi:hypothetical protein
MWLLPKGADKLIAQLDGKAKNEDQTTWETLEQSLANPRVINQNSKLF